MTWSQKHAFLPPARALFSPCRPPARWPELTPHLSDQGGQPRIRQDVPQRLGLHSRH